MRSASSNASAAASTGPRLAAVVQALVVAGAVFGASAPAPHGVELAEAAERSMRTAATVRQIAQLERWPADARSDLFGAAPLGLR